MTAEEFVIWMQGVVIASSNYNITPATWDAIKDGLAKVTIAGKHIQTVPPGNGLKAVPVLGGYPLDPRYSTTTYNIRPEKELKTKK